LSISEIIAPLFGNQDIGVKFKELPNWFTEVTNEL